MNSFSEIFFFRRKKWYYKISGSYLKQLIDIKRISKNSTSDQLTFSVH